MLLNKILNFVLYTKNENYWLYFHDIALTSDFLKHFFGKPWSQMVVLFNVVMLPLFMTMSCWSLMQALTTNNVE